MLIDKNSLVMVHVPENVNQGTSDRMRQLVEAAIKKVRDGKGPVTIDLPANTFLSIIEVAPAAVYDA